MADLEGLQRRYRGVVEGITQTILGGRRILVVSHIDADGLCSGSIVFSSLTRRGANVTLRTVPDLDPTTVGELGSQKYDFYVFVDLASTMVSELDSVFPGRYLVIDHHEISETDIRNPSVVNAWFYGYDGGKEACSSTMAYYFALAVDPTNKDLSSLAVVGALADRQESGQGRSLAGLNRVALEDAQGRGLIAVSSDLMFTGRETRPVHEAIALTSTPFLKGLTGSKDAVLATLHQSGLELKEGGAWRTISSLTPEEKGKLTEIIAGALGSQEGATEILANLFGEVYTLKFEDPFTPLRDAREFGTLLNSCGRMGLPSVGVSICLGDRSAGLRDAMKTLGEYRSGINRALDAVTSDPSRIEQHGHTVLVRGEGLVDERLLGPVISILTSSPAYKDKVVVGSATSRGTDLKISSRVGDSFQGEVNLGKIMREAAEAVEGVGGGHAMAAGARIPSSKAETFSRAVVTMVAA